MSQAASTTAASLVFGSPTRYTKFCIGPVNTCRNQIFSGAPVLIPSSPSLAPVSS